MQRSIKTHLQNAPPAFFIHKWRLKVCWQTPQNYTDTKVLPKLRDIAVWDRYHSTSNSLFPDFLSRHASPPPISRNRTLTVSSSSSRGSRIHGDGRRSESVRCVEIHRGSLRSSTAATGDRRRTLAPQARCCSCRCSSSREAAWISPGLGRRSSALFAPPDLSAWSPSRSHPTSLRCGASSRFTSIECSLDDSSSFNCLLLSPKRDPAFDLKVIENAV